MQLNIVTKECLGAIGISFCYYKNRAVADYLLLNPKWMLNALFQILRQSNYDEVASEQFDKVKDLFAAILSKGVAQQLKQGLYREYITMHEAQGDYEKALEVRERVLGSGHPDTATTYNNMAGVYQDQGDYEKALEYYRKALEVRERVLGSGHPSTATTYNNMAGVYKEQGDYEKALEYYGKALEISERVLGSDHPYTATAYSNMAVVYQEQGDYEKALEYYGKALEVSERVLESDHPNTATTYNNMAVVYQEQGDYEKALDLYEKSLTVFMVKLGENHPYTQSAQVSVEIMKLYLMTGLNEDQLIEMIRNTPPEVLQEKMQLFSNGIDHAGEDHSVS